MTLLVHPTLPAPGVASSDAVAGQVAELLEAVASCDDPARLRTALWVLAGALPDLMITTEPMDAVVATARRALAGSWP